MIKQMTHSSVSFSEHSSLVSSTSEVNIHIDHIDHNDHILSPARQPSNIGEFKWKITTYFFKAFGMILSNFGKKMYFHLKKCS